VAHASAISAQKTHHSVTTTAAGKVTVLGNSVSLERLAQCLGIHTPDHGTGPTTFDDERLAHRNALLSRLPPERRKQAEARQAEFDAGAAQQDWRARIGQARERIALIGPF
jgi:hypothetical protein